MIAATRIGRHGAVRRLQIGRPRKLLSRAAATATGTQYPAMISTSILLDNNNGYRRYHSSSLPNQGKMLVSKIALVSTSLEMGNNTTRQNFFSTVTSSDTTHDHGSSSQDHPGQAIYQEALDALQQVERLQQEQETKKAEELHRAIERAETKEREHANNPKAKNLKGVTVVKTVVKQTRKELKTQNNKKQQSTEDEWREKAYQLLQQAAEHHGHGPALILLGNMALQQAHTAWMQQDHNDEARQFVKQALDYYEKAGTNGAAEGWFNLGQLLWTGYPARDDDEKDDTTTTLPADNNIVLAPDWKASMTAFRKAIQLHDPDAMYFVGVQLLLDNHTNAIQPDNDNNNNNNNNNTSPLQEGLDLVESSAAMGHGPARYYLALLHLNGNDDLGIPPCSPQHFVTLLNDACAADHPDALFLRGTCRHEGDHGYHAPVDYELALADFVAAAEAGHADAAVSAGAMLHQGRPPTLPPNRSKAFDLYQLAGELGSREGWRNVVACYALGEGVPRSEATARYIAKTMLLQEDDSDEEENADR